MLETIVKYSNKECSAEKVMASVIWLHGLGADGYDFADIVPVLSIPSWICIKFVFPHAPNMPVTVNSGMVMRAWYDIEGIGDQFKDDIAGIIKTSESVSELIEAEHNSGIEYKNIFIAGFSQGGAVALYTATRYLHRLGGIIALSTYLPVKELLGQEMTEENSDIPILMMHGQDDIVVPIKFALQSKNVLLQHKYSLHWADYPMGHSVCLEQLKSIGQWITQHIKQD